MKDRLAFPLLLLCLAAAAVLARCSGPLVQTQLALGLWAAENNLWDEALYRWKKEVEAHPASAAAHNNLAVALEKKGLWEEARKEYEAALKLAPAHPRIKLNYQKFKDNLDSPVKDKEKDSEKEIKGADEKNI